MHEGSSPRTTSWSKQTSEDRGKGLGRQSITLSGGDRNFVISSRGTIGPSEFPDTSELTIASLSEDLDDIIIFCGFEDPLANFTIRIYRELNPLVLCGYLTVQQRMIDMLTTVIIHDAPLILQTPQL